MEDFKNYIEDCLDYLIDNSILVNEKSLLSKDPFDQGLAFGYYEILNFLLGQTEVFEIKGELKEKIKAFKPSL